MYAIMVTYIILSEGALKGAAGALRLSAKLLGLGREASPSAVSISMAFHAHVNIVMSKEVYTATSLISACVLPSVSLKNTIHVSVEPIFAIK